MECIITADFCYSSNNQQRHRYIWHCIYLFLYQPKMVTSKLRHFTQLPLKPQWCFSNTLPATLMHLFEGHYPDVTTQILLGNASKIIKSLRMCSSFELHCLALSLSIFTSYEYRKTSLQSPPNSSTFCGHHIFIASLLAMCSCCHSQGYKDCTDILWLKNWRFMCVNFCQYILRSFHGTPKYAVCSHLKLFKLSNKKSY